MVLVCIYIIFECHILTLIASSGQGNYSRSMGVRIGRQFSVSSTWLHGGCCQTRHSNLTADHQRPHSSRHNSLRRMGRSVQNLSYFYSHGTVNHSVTFVDPTTGVHSQNVGSYWCRVKTKLKRMRGCHSLTSSPAVYMAVEIRQNCS